MQAPAKFDRLERVTDLVLVLLHARQPLTLDAIANQVPGYPAEHPARRQAFERDKRMLRDEGIPVLTQWLGGTEQYGYRIDGDAFYLPDLDLDPDEQVALHLAVAGVHLGDPSGRDALLKLGAAGLSDVRPIASLVPSAPLIELFEAVRIRATATFTYRAERRLVAPVGLRFRFGHWYLVAWDLERTAVRTFRVDRIDGAVERGEPAGSQVPEDLDVEGALPEEPWQAEGENVVSMRLMVDPLEGARVADEVGQDKVTRRFEDGSVELVLAVSSFASIRSWVLGLLEHVTVLEPQAFRTELVEWLAAMIDAPAAPADMPAPLTWDSEEAPPVRTAPGRETSDRLRRLLAIVGWLAQVGQATIAEVSQRFGIGEEELVAELELAACCGTPPYTPDTLMEIEVSEHSVRAFLPAEYARPRRLTPAEGFAVAASARLLLAVPGSDSDALRRALAKLDTVLGSRGAVGLDVDAPANLAVIREAADAGKTLEIDYHSASRDELTTRTVEPVQVVTLRGHWYLDAFCRRAGDMRSFRVDRIVRACPLDEPPSEEERRVGLTGDLFVPGPSAIEVHLQLAPDAAWVPETVPVRAVRRDREGTVTDVVLDVEGMAWFQRLLLQLGLAARVVSPPELTGLGAEAARRVLVRYEPPDGEGSR